MTAAKATSWAFLRRHLVAGRGSHPEGPSDCGDWGLGPLGTCHGPEAVEPGIRPVEEARDHLHTRLSVAVQLSGWLLIPKQKRRANPSNPMSEIVFPT